LLDGFRAKNEGRELAKEVSAERWNVFRVMEVEAVDDLVDVERKRELY